MFVKMVTLYLSSSNMAIPCDWLWQGKTKINKDDDRAEAIPLMTTVKIWQDETIYKSD